MKKMYFDVIIYFIGTALVAIFSFVLSLLYSQMFKPSDYGVYSLCFSTYTLASSFLAGWIGSSIIRFYKQYDDKSAIFISTIFKVFIIYSFLLFILFNLVLFFLNLDRIVKLLSFTLSLLFVVENLVLMINSLFRSKSMSKRYNFNTILNSILKMLLVLLFYYIFDITYVTIIVISAIIADLIIIVISMFNKKTITYLREKIDLSIFFELLKYGLPLIMISISYWIMNVSDRFVIQIFFPSMEEVGIYSYSYSLGNSLFFTLSQFIMLGAYPAIVASWDKDNTSNSTNLIKKYMNMFFVVLIPALIGVLIISKNFFICFIDEKYFDGYFVFSLACVTLFIVGLSQYYNKPFELMKKTKNMNLIFLICAVVNLILNFSLIPFFGYRIASITTVISYSLYLVIDIIFSRKLLIINIDWKFLFKVIAASIIMGMIVFCINYFMPISRISLIVSISAGIIIYSILAIVLKIIDVGLIFNKIRRNK